MYLEISKALALDSESPTPNALPSQLRPTSPSGSTGSTMEELDMEVKAWQELDNSQVKHCDWREDASPKTAGALSSKTTPDSKQHATPPWQQGSNTLQARKQPDKDKAMRQR